MWQAIFIVDAGYTLPGLPIYSSLWIQIQILAGYLYIDNNSNNNIDIMHALLISIKYIFGVGPIKVNLYFLPSLIYCMGRLGLSSLLKEINSLILFNFTYNEYSFRLGHRSWQLTYGITLLMITKIRQTHQPVIQLYLDYL